MTALSFQDNAKIRKIGVEERALCLVKVYSLDLMSWVEAVYFNVRYFSSSSIRLGGLQPQHRARGRQSLLYL